ncbi:MAG: hypothetical protein R6U40_08300 [Desulfobacterales bacterium]
MKKLKNKRKIISTVVFVILLLVALIPGPRHLVFENRFFAGIDTEAKKYVDNALLRAASAFALARTFNAIVSVIQESEVQVQPAGLGVSFAVGQALDPINDLVERFSWVMLVSLTSLGVQNVLIEVSPWVSINLLLVVALSMLLTGLWIDNRYSIDFYKTGKTLVLVVFIVRFAVPAMAYLNNHVYVSILEQRHNETIDKIEADVQQMKENEFGQFPSTDQLGEKNEQGLKNKIKSALNQGKNLIDVRSRLQTIKTITGRLFDKFVKLIVVFILNTIVLPIAFLWGIVKIGRLFINQEFGLNLERYFVSRIKGENEKN